MVLWALPAVLLRAVPVVIIPLPAVLLRAASVPAASAPDGSGPAAIGPAVSGPTASGAAPPAASVAVGEETATAYIGVAARCHGRPIRAGAGVLGSTCSGLHKTNVEAQV